MFILISLIIIIASLELAFKWTKRDKKFKTNNSIALITGGSSGLGLAIAEQLLQRGCKLVILLARGSDKLENAKGFLSEIYGENRVTIQSADVTDYKQMKELCEVLVRENVVPDFVFCCAGASNPGFFLEQDHLIFEAGMKLNYMGTFNITHAISKIWQIKEKKLRKIIFISSTLGLMGMIGYSQYSPSKFAIRGLAECLHQELKPFEIDVHIYYVSTIITPGYEQESLTKPQVTKILEGVEGSDASAGSRAKTLIKGLERGDFVINSDALTSTIYGIGRGMSFPNSPLILGSLLGLFSPLISLFWNLYADWVVKKSLKIK